MCSIIVAKIEGIENNEIRDAIMSFKVPEHRLEYVTKIGKQNFIMIQKQQILNLQSLRLIPSTTKM